MARLIVSVRYETVRGAIEKEASNTVEFEDGTIPDHAREMGEQVGQEVHDFLRNNKEYR